MDVKKCNGRHIEPTRAPYSLTIYGRANVVVAFSSLFPVRKIAL